MERNQQFLQPPEDSTDVTTVIRGVIKAEEAAIAQYEKIIEICEPVDLITQDIIIDLAAQEQAHRREFVGFLFEYERTEASKLAHPV